MTDDSSGHESTPNDKQACNRGARNVYGANITRTLKPNQLACYADNQLKCDEDS